MATKCTKWDFGVMSKEDWKTADASGWAVVEQLQALNEFLAENQVLRCSTRITLDRILRELEGLRRDLRQKRAGKTR